MTKIRINTMLNSLNGIIQNKLTTILFPLDSIRELFVTCIVFSSCDVFFSLSQTVYTDPIVLIPTDHNIRRVHTDRSKYSLYITMEVT